MLIARKSVERCPLVKPLKQSLQQKGLAFNDTDPDPFRDVLRKAGFYNEWRGRYGHAAWATLEEFSGKLT
jgi:TRAP-type transport system periplasmic protein